LLPRPDALAPSCSRPEGLASGESRLPKREKGPSPNQLLFRLLELMKPVGDKHDPDHPEDGLLSILTDNHRDIQLFDFGDLGAIPDDEWSDLETYAWELMANDMFELPYPYTAICTAPTLLSLLPWFAIPGLLPCCYF
jgi:hypothetical protein